jgi:hypothetical protein
VIPGREDLLRWTVGKPLIVPLLEIPGQSEIRWCGDRSPLQGARRPLSRRTWAASSDGGLHRIEIGVRLRCAEVPTVGMAVRMPTSRQDGLLKLDVARRFAELAKIEHVGGNFRTFAL